MFKEHQRRRTSDCRLIERGDCSIQVEPNKGQGLDSALEAHYIQIIPYMYCIGPSAPIESLLSYEIDLEDRQTGVDNVFISITSSGYNHIIEFEYL